MVKIVFCKNILEPIFSKKISESYKSILNALRTHKHFFFLLKNTFSHFKSTFKQSFNINTNSVFITMLFFCLENVFITMLFIKKNYINFQVLFSHVNKRTRVQLINGAYVYGQQLRSLSTFILDSGFDY